jgi:NAD(P)-dependent dehydrogenase (short-subunit alcohol dehydrogenase family)
MATAVVITGASRGFGRAAAIALTAELAAAQKRTDLVRVLNLENAVYDRYLMISITQFLWARNAEKLQDTERAVHATAKKFDASAQTFSSSVDLGNQASYVGHVESLVQQVGSGSPTIRDRYQQRLSL